MQAATIHPLFVKHVATSRWGPRGQHSVGTDHFPGHTRELARSNSPHILHQPPLFRGQPVCVLVQRLCSSHGACCSSLGVQLAGLGGWWPQPVQCQHCAPPPCWLLPEPVPPPPRPVSLILQSFTGNHNFKGPRRCAECSTSSPLHRAASCSRSCGPTVLRRRWPLPPAAAGRPLPPANPLSASGARIQKTTPPPSSLSLQPAVHSTSSGLRSMRCRGVPWVSRLCPCPRVDVSDQIWRSHRPSHPTSPPSSPVPRLTAPEGCEPV